MSLSTQTLRRLPTIKQGLLQGLNYTSIGSRCGVTEKTIDRDIKAFVDSGEFETWIKQEWARLYSVIQKEEPVEAFRNLTKLLGRMVTRKVEAHTLEEIKVEEKHVSIVGTLRDYEEAINQAASRDFQANRARKQVDTHNADT